MRLSYFPLCAARFLQQRPKYVRIAIPFGAVVSARLVDAEIFTGAAHLPIFFCGMLVQFRRILGKILKIKLVRENCLFKNSENLFMP